MNESLKAVIIEVSGDNLRNHHIDLRGTFGLFPDDSLGGDDQSPVGQSIRLRIGLQNLDTDIDKDQAMFRERSAVRRFFDDESIVEGDLLIIERVGERSYNVSKASKRGFRYYL